MVSEITNDLAWALNPVRFAQDNGGRVEDPYRPKPYAPYSWQQTFLGTHAQKTLMLCTRQGGKTTVVGIRIAHQAVYHPGTLTLVVSKSERQSKIMFRKARRILEAFRGMEQFPEDNKTSVELVNGSVIAALPGSEDTIRGFSGPTLIIIDEAARVDDALYLALRPMLQDRPHRPTPEMIALTTPWGRRGWFYDCWKLKDDHAQGRRLDEPDIWTRYIWTAEDAVREGAIKREWLDRERRTLPEWFYRQEYLCEFVETEESLVSEADIESAIKPGVETWEL